MSGEAELQTDSSLNFKKHSFEFQMGGGNSVHARVFVGEGARAHTLLPYK